MRGAVREDLSQLHSSTVNPRANRAHLDAQSGRNLLVAQLLYVTQNHCHPHVLRQFCQCFLDIRIESSIVHQCLRHRIAAHQEIVVLAHE